MHPKNVVFRGSVERVQRIKTFPVDFNVDQLPANLTQRLVNAQVKLFYFIPPVSCRGCIRSPSGRPPPCRSPPCQSCCRGRWTPCVCREWRSVRCTDCYQRGLCSRSPASHSWWCKWRQGWHWGCLRQVWRKEVIKGCGSKFNTSKIYSLTLCNWMESSWLMQINLWVNEIKYFKVSKFLKPSLAIWHSWYS